MPPFGVLELDRAAEVLAQRFHQRLELRAQPPPQLRNVLREIARAELRQHHLLERAGTGVGLEREHARHDFPRRDDVAHAQRRRDRFRERADIDDAAVLAHRVDRGRTLPRPGQVGIAVVFEDRHAVRRREPRASPAAAPPAGWSRSGSARSGWCRCISACTPLRLRSSSAFESASMRMPSLSSGMPTMFTPMRFSRLIEPW